MNYIRKVALRSYFSVLNCLRFDRFKSGLSMSGIRMRIFTQKRNPITGTTDWDMQDKDYDYHQEIARSAFADMLHDTERNQKYGKALRLAIEKVHKEGKKAHVLDIGTGTGLLSIMAAKAGADSIVACEAFQPMAECCLKILESNGVADKITVIPKRSTELTVGVNGDMKQRANILVTEVFDTELIGEGALSTFAHAHKYLLEDDAIVVPDSAVIYAQVVECPTLQKCNKINDLADEDLKIILKTPKKIKDCAGSAAVHDIQLSQVPRHTFRELSDQIPVFYYDWSGATPIIMQRTVKQEFSVLTPGKAQVVLMWWELNMDQEGKISLSCAPWWVHSDTNMSAQKPDTTIPWRDHWMQAVYYLPQEVELHKNMEASLVSCQDEYSLWFYVETDSKLPHYRRPICECGVHMAFSRTHVSYLNDGRRSKRFLSQLKEELTSDSVVLDLNGNSLMGLAAAKMGAKKVFIVEKTTMHSGILTDYIKENKLSNVTVIPDANEEVLKQVTIVLGDPNFTSALLPWDNLKLAFLVHKYRPKMNSEITIIPEGCEFWAMPVEFENLHKIRVPLGTCEGIDMTVFDEMVENSRVISDSEVEPQPLWEYPTYCRGAPAKLISVDFRDIKPTYAVDGTQQLVESQSDNTLTVNGFALWAVWKIGGKDICSGPMQTPVLGDKIEWDPHTRQAVKILKKTHTMKSEDKWSYQIACDIAKGQFNVKVDVVVSE